MLCLTRDTDQMKLVSLLLYQILETSSLEEGFCKPLATTATGTALTSTTSICDVLVLVKLLHTATNVSVCMPSLIVNMIFKS